jgi:hypothetical protein
VNDILHPSPESSVKEYEWEVEALWFSVNEPRSGELELEEMPRFN